MEGMYEQNRSKDTLEAGKKTNPDIGAMTSAWETYETGF
jgi:hypothetical protein